MKCSRARILGSAFILVTTVFAVACSGPAETEASDGNHANRKVARDPDGPPADYVRARCSLCSCPFFGGESGNCARPTCRHPWSDHK